LLAGLTKMQKFRRLKHTTSVRLRYHSSTTKKYRWKRALIAVDTASDISVISRRLINQDLHIPIRKVEGEIAQRLHASNQWPNDTIIGYVDLTWRMEQNPHMEYRTQFFVESHNPYYTVILGRQDAKRANMLNK